MPSKPLFRRFWHPQQANAEVPENATGMEVPVNKLENDTAEKPTDPQGELLSCEDIYRASGILGVPSKYDISKIVEMLNSKHIRELPNEVKRASVLMALDAAGTTVDEVLHDATRRQHALNAYESCQQKQFEEFEARKARENAHIKTEMERITAHYTARIQRNLDLVAREKEALHNWQRMKEQENQRIADAAALCGKQPGAEASRDALPALPAARSAAGTA